MSADFSYLSDSDREQLRQLPFPVALPTRLPSGWSAGPLSVFGGDEDGDVSCSAMFSGPGASKWAISSTNEGIGDVLPLDSSQTMSGGVLGELLVHQGVEDEVALVQSDWFPDEEDAECYHCFHGSEVAEADLAALASSLALANA